MSEQAGLVEQIMDDLVALEERLDAVEDDLADIDDLRDRVERLEERTDMLRLIEEADQLEADQRRAALWQHCVRQAEASQTGRVALDRDDVEDALHYPDIERTTFYTDMRAVARRTPDEVAEYKSAQESETGGAELRVDLSSVDEAVDASTLYEGGD